MIPLLFRPEDIQSQLLNLLGEGKKLKVILQRNLQCKHKFVISETIYR